MIACSLGCKRVETWAETHSAQHQSPVASRPRPELYGPGLADGTYRIVDVRVEAEPFKRNGKPWDDPDVAQGAEPDLKIELSVDGRTVATCDGPDDSAVARCRLDVEVKVDRATQLSICVHDRDTVFDDFVGTGTLRDPLHWGIGIDLPLATSAQLASAVIVLADVPSFWETAEPRLIAGGIGLLAATLVILLMRRRRPSAEPPSRTLEPAHRILVRHDPLLLLATGAAGAAVGFDAASLTHALVSGTAIVAAFGLGIVGMTFLVVQVAQTRRLQAHHVMLFVVIIAVAILPVGPVLLQAVALGVVVLSLFIAALN